MTFLVAPDPTLPLKRLVQDFTSTPVGPLSTDIWANRFIQGDNRTVPEIASSGYMRASMTIEWNRNSRLHTVPNDWVNTDNHRIQAALATAVNGLHGGLSVRMDAGMVNGVFCILSTDSAARGLWSLVNGTPTRVVTLGALTYTVGQFMALSVNDNVYQLIQNPSVDWTGGTVRATWTDTNRITKVGPDYRRSGFYINSDANSTGTKNYGPGWLNYDCRDLGWVA